MSGFTGPELLLILSPSDIFVVVLILVLLFGGKKIPDLAKGFGKGIRNFKTSIKEEQQADKDKKQS